MAFACEERTVALIILTGIHKFIPVKHLSDNPDPEYCNKEIRKLKRKLRKSYSQRKESVVKQTKFTQLAKELLNAKKKAQENYLNKLFKGEQNGWGEFYKYVKRRRKDDYSSPPLKNDFNQFIVQDREKAEKLNSYYATVFGRRAIIPNLVSVENTGQFSIKPRDIRRRISKLKTRKSVGPDGIAGDMLKLGGEAMISYLVRIFEISINNGTVPRDWKDAIVVPIYKSGSRSETKNYRPVSLTSVVCKQMEHLISTYLRKHWNDLNWLHNCQHGFRGGYSCESQLVTVCQDLADGIDSNSQVDAVIIDFSRAFDVVPHDILLVKLQSPGVDFRVLQWIKEFLTCRTQRVRVGE